jgi:hypothetical protein
MGEHRQISGVPAGAAHAGGCTSHAIRTVPLTLMPAKNSPVSFSPIGRSPHISWRAVKGTQAQVPSPAWSPGRRGRAPLAAAPRSLRQGQSGQLPLPLLYIADSPAGATHLSPGCCVGNGIGVVGPVESHDRVNRPKRAIFSLHRMGAGRWVSLDTNTLRHSKRQSNSMKKSAANGCTGTELLYNIPSSAFPSVLWVLGKARRKDCQSSNVVVNSNSHVAVFPIQRMKY